MVRFDRKHLVNRCKVTFLSLVLSKSKPGMYQIPRLDLNFGTGWMSQIRSVHFIAFDLM